MIRAILLFIFSWSCLPFAFGNGILIEQSGDSEVMGKPGEVVNIVYRLTNQTTSDFHADPKWKLPESWEVISNKTAVYIGAGQSVLKIYSIHISPRALAGKYSLEFGLTSIYNSRINDSDIATVAVQADRHLHIEPAAVPEFVEAGDHIYATFVLQNLGNVAGYFNVVAENCELEGDPDIYLKAGETKVLQTRTKTLATIRNMGRVFLKIYVWEKASDEIAAYSSSFVKVIPTINTKREGGHFLPVSIRFSQITRQWQDGKAVSGFQGELYTNGSLDEAGENRFEMRLRGPDRFGLSLLGQYDEYFARFENKNITAHIGDKSYSLSPLTDFARYGRGVEAAIKTQEYKIGGYVHNPRFFPELSQVSAGYIEYNYTENLLLRVNAMHKVFSENRGDAALGGVEGKFSTIGNTIFESEISKGMRNGKDWGNAFMVRMNSNPLKKLLLSANYTYADKNYPGYYTNTACFYTNANFQATSKLGFSALMNQDARNNSRDTLFGASPFSRLTQIGVFYKFKGDISTRTYIRSNELQDRMPSLKFHYKEDLIRWQVEKNWKGTELTLTNEFGQRKNLLETSSDRLTKTYRLFLNGGHRFSHRLSINAMAQYFWFKKLASNQNRQWIFGGNIQAEPFPFSRFGISFQTSYQLEDYYRNRNLFDLNFSQRLGKNRNHELSVSANYALLQRTQSQRDISVQVSYSCQLNIRTDRRQITQGVIGQLLNKGAMTIEGVSLTLNGREIKTDEEGRFYFQNIPAGKYYLLIDPSSIELHELADIPMPIEVKVEKGMDTQVEFGLTKGATINGVIDTEPEIKSTKNFNNSEAPKLFMLEISDGKETLRRLANPKKFF